MYCSISGRNLFIDAYSAIDVRLCFLMHLLFCLCSFPFSISLSLDHNILKVEKHLSGHCFFSLLILMNKVDSNSSFSE